ncbi:MAG: hypothetical protein H8E86_01860 [Planctomycetes bacterium]|nr:hypothetical protein [Planctomycetota bacterium]
MTTSNPNQSGMCVVLVPPDRTQAAQQAAQKFALEPCIEHEPALAMAELCIHVAHLRTNQAWCETPASAHLILIHAQELVGIAHLIAAIRKYIPSVKISEFRDGCIQEIENAGAVVDSLGELPIVQLKDVDANELSMLLDSNPQETDE